MMGKIGTGAMDMLELAWGIIANAGGGNWKTQTKDWQKAAAEWRDKYHNLLKGQNEAERGYEKQTMASQK